VVEANNDIKSLPEVEGVKTIVVLTREGGRGGRIPLEVVALMGV
jgi:hypothetical protein